MTDSPVLDADASNGGPKKKKRRGMRRLVIALVTIVALIAVAAGVLFALLANSFQDVQRVAVAQDPALVRPEPANNGAVNILLLGSDSREATDPELDGADMVGNRSDSIMVAQISPDGGVAVMSIMRDNWVEVQGYGEAKINAAMSFGGLPLAINTIENFIGARIDHVAMIDFESFKGLTDALGGVTVTNDNAFTTLHGEYNFEPGEITLSGDDALAFVRERYAFADGDYQRARNQQAFMRGLAKKLLSAETLSDPKTVTSTFDALKPYLILDDEFTATELVKLGWQARGARGDNITFFTSPTLGTGTSPDGQSIVVPDWDEMARVQAAFAEGSLPDYAASRVPGSELPQ